MPCSETQNFVTALQGDLAREQKLSASLSPLLASDEEYVSAAQRDQCLQHLLKLSLHFGFEPETFALAVNYTDRFLCKVKAHTKYLQCIGLTSLYVAAKMSEEEEFVPMATDFVNVSRAQCTASDLLRMEGILLQKLEWSLFVPTPVLFLQKFCDLLQLFGSLSYEFASTIVQHILPKILRLLCHSSFAEHKGSTLALALLQYEISPLSPSLCSALDDVIKILQIDYGAFMHCLGLVQDFMDCQATFRKKKFKSRKRRKSSRSNSLHILPTIYESTDNQNDYEGSEISDDVFDDSAAEQMDEGCVDNDHNNNMTQKNCMPVYDSSNDWLDDKHEFPDIFETLSTPIRRTRKSGKVRFNPTGQTSHPDKPLYSTIVKTSWSSIAYVYQDHSFELCTETVAF
ncbi:cyclin-I-like [Rhopilema esculentum]|uniref:cyclin-I-like n=1 Tax=Rhopilema esculentum TaxID=499914 RepID=UPI0031E089C3